MGGAVWGFGGISLRQTRRCAAVCEFFAEGCSPSGGSERPGGDDRFFCISGLVCLVVRAAIVPHGANQSGHGHSSMDGERRYILRDRKSTRLNSSHVRISYAVF